MKTHDYREHLCGNFSMQTLRLLDTWHVSEAYRVHYTILGINLY